jgi:acylphosphatase
VAIRKRVLYRGQVQGVGFRATAHSIAAGHAVGGFVRNLPDGRVELVLEGEPAQVQAVLSELGDRMESFIREAAEQEEPPRGERVFRIAR